MLLRCVCVCVCARARVRARACTRVRACVLRGLRLGRAVQRIGDVAHAPALLAASLCREVPEVQTRLLKAFDAKSNADEAMEARNAAGRDVLTEMACAVQIFRESQSLV